MGELVSNIATIPQEKKYIAKVEGILCEKLEESQNLLNLENGKVTMHLTYLTQQMINKDLYHTNIITIQLSCVCCCA